jgi:hypothetical protein
MGIDGVRFTEQNQCKRYHCKVYKKQNRCIIITSRQAAARH